MFGISCDGCKHLRRVNLTRWRKWLRAIGIPVPESQREIMARECRRIFGVRLRTQDERWPGRADGLPTCGPLARFREVA
jgi:hypothetical protein